MSYCIWMSAALASWVWSQVDVELGQRLLPHWQRLAEVVTRFFGPRGFARDGAGIRAGGGAGGP